VVIGRGGRSRRGGLTGARWWVASALILVASLAATVPTTGDVGLTWDAPASAWAKDDPRGFRDAAETLARRLGDPGDAPGARRLRAMLDRYPPNRAGAFARVLFRARPEALPEAVTILTRRPDLVRTILTRYPYTEPADLDPGGAPYLDEAP
jgi:hypothetical protein